MSRPMTDYHEARDGESHGNQDDKKSNVGAVLKPLLETSEISVLDSKELGSRQREARARDISSAVLQAWWTELVSLCIAVCACCAIVIVVYPYRTPREIPDWPSSITINTVISILSITFRAGLVVAVSEALGQQKWISFTESRKLSDMCAFDEATRGPLGSLLLAWRLSKFSSMGVFGATILLLSVAVGPFGQQLIRFTNCSLKSHTQVATVPRRNAITALGDGASTGQNELPLAMLGHMYTSIYAPQASAVQFDCPGDGCSLSQPFHTLGFCSRCFDISETLQIKNETIQYQYAQMMAPMNVTTYSLPSGLFIQHEVAGEGFTKSLISNASGPAFTQEYYLSDLREMQIIALPKSLESCTEEQHNDSVTSWQCKGYGAAQCAVNPCVQTLIAKMTGGVITETVVATATEWGGDARDYSMINVPCLADVEKQHVRAQGYVFDTDTRWMPYNSSLDVGDLAASWTDERDQPNFPVHCVYWYNVDVIGTISRRLSGLLSGNATIHENTYNTKGDDWIHSSVPKVMYNDSFTSFALINSLFNNISIGLTNGIRQTGNYTYWPRMPGESWPKNVTDFVYAGNLPALGAVYHNTTCVEVRWPWLAYPACLGVLAFVFVVLTIKNSSLRTSLRASNANKEMQSGQDVFDHRSMGIWKTSLLPFMFHGLEDSTLRGENPLQPTAIARMKGTAKTMNVKLAPHKDGWKLSSSAT